MTSAALAPPPHAAGSRPFLASRKHTFTLLGILLALTGMGLLRAAKAPATSGPSGTTALLVTYAVAIGLQAAWVRFVQGGMRAQGRRLSELWAPAWTGPQGLARDLAWAALAFGLMLGVGQIASVALKGAQGNVGFLMPHGVVASAGWVLTACAAGIGEEIVFRGYLQRQLTAWTGHEGLAVGLQALLFTLPHVYQGLKPMVPIAMVGLLLGLLAWRRGNIRSGILAHAAVDIVGGLMG